MPAMYEQQQIDYWSVARMSKLPGATITTTLDSTQWTVRTKNAVKRMLMRGQIIGGYSSVTAKLADAIAKQYGVQCTKTNSGYVEVIEPTADMRVKLFEIIKADYMAFRLDNNGHHRDWLKDRMERAERELAKPIAKFSYYFNERQFAEQARDMVSALNTPENVERARVACAAVDQGETFTYHTVQ